MNMELKQGFTYTLVEIYEFLGITIYQWRRNKKKYLDHLSKYYEFEEIKDPEDKRRTLIKINKKIKDYKPLLSKSQQKRLVIKQKILELLSKNNIQTGASIFRKLKNDKDIINLKYRESTLKNYICRELRELKESGRIILLNKKWMGIDDDNNYIELSDNELKELKNCYINLFDENNIEITSYGDVVDLFISLNNLYPIKVPVYDVGAF